MRLPPILGMYLKLSSTPKYNISEFIRQAGASLGLSKKMVDGRKRYFSLVYFFNIFFLNLRLESMYDVVNYMLLVAYGL